ncbi:hypothetical protein CEW81_18225 [Kluyvera genomosp. 3]|uniref:Uncharacterized protein n=1 Tax=Kluyvera genomosp. 3 TaxID=2774055 RepID=A0A248KJC9_9ENTR|nr:hypothetical protein CEW81_18225 [Kluyvera genomosp. 3]
MYGGWQVIGFVVMVGVAIWILRDDMRGRRELREMDRMNKVRHEELLKRRELAEERGRGVKMPHKRWKR